jgi:hypothetical protein
MLRLSFFIKICCKYPFFFRTFAADYYSSINLKMKKHFILCAFLLMVVMIANAAPRTQAQMKEAAAKAVNGERLLKKMAIRNAADMKVLKSTAEYQIIGNEQGGFAVIAADDLVPEVLGVSMSKYSEGRNENFQWWLEAVQGAVQYAVTHNVVMSTTKPDASKYPTQVGPLLTTEWDQGEPYNRLLPQSIYGGGRCVTGCVATAMAQVLNYHQVPVCGIGSRTIYYPYQDTSGTPITADFGEHNYDWENMLDIYSPGSYNEEQAMAVAVLMRDCGVATDMQYGGSNNTENGSGAYSQDAAAGLRTYFGIADAECLERDHYSESAWMDIVYRALSEEGPCYYGGASWSSGGHAFVLHGYNAEGKVYVNWGWSGDDDGYYDIALLNPGWYTFNLQQDMIIGVKGAPRELSDEVVALTEAGTLSTILDDEKIGTVGSLKISGNINSSDLRQIRRLAGVDEMGEKTGGYLQQLDLSEARFVSGGDAYLIDNGKQLTTADDELSAKAFFGCKYLTKLVLPAGLKTWGEGAVGLCSQISEIEIGEPAADADYVIDNDIVWNTDKTEIIAVLPIKSGDLDIAKGTVALRDYAMAGCGRLSKVVLPASLTTIGREAMNGCSALQEIRVVNKEIPELGGANVFAGVSIYTCKLYVPAGTKTKYAKLAQWKDFKGMDYDNIIEYGSSVKVRNTIRNYGEDNPRFVYSVSGDPITGEPELICEATPSSPAGKYPVIIKMGTITTENVDLVDGYLIVQKVNATATVGNFSREEGMPNPEFGFSSYEGLIALDSIPAWLEEPVFETTADENSPVGEYPITVKSANLTFIAGTLTITEATGPRVVTPPADLQTEEWLLTGQRYDPTEYTVDATQTLNIGIQGQDVYVQGLNLYLPGAWVKGTIEDGKVTFAANQYYGDLADDVDTLYNTYFAGCDASWFEGVSTLQPIDVTFTMNEAGDRWSTATVLVVNTLTDGIAGFDFLKDVVLAKPHDVAATPKAPEIYFYQPYDVVEGYGGVALTFPPVDVDGNPLLTDKLSYIIYKDVEKTVSPIVIPALQEDGETFVDMTEIPYNFTDDYNIEAHGYAAYFYEPSSAFNRIGVQAIYRGGNEERMSEINWLVLQPYADEATIFDFNALDKETTPVSTSTSHDGDITEDKVLKEGEVTLTISPCEVGNTPNRYWVDYNLQAIQLRLYGGKLTFEVPNGCTIEKIYFFASDWNDYNEFDNGEFDGQIWTGAANNVVLTIDDGNPNTKLNKIAVVVSGTSGVSTVQFQPIEVLRTFDLQGRELQGNVKGLVIEQVRTADGQVKNVKRMRK